MNRSVVWKTYPTFGCILHATWETLEMRVELDVSARQWTVVQLGDLVRRVAGGGTPSTKVASYWDGPIPWTTSAVIGQDDVYLTCYQRGITGNGIRASSTNVAPKGSVLLGTRVGVGKAVVTTFDVAIRQDLTCALKNGFAPFLQPGFALGDLVPRLMRDSLRLSRDGFCSWTLH